MPVCLLAYALATCTLMRLHAYAYALMCASVPTRLCAHAEVFVRHHFTTKREFLESARNRLFTGGFWKQNMCLVVVFPGFGCLVVNQTTTKHPIWYLFRKKRFVGDFNGHSMATTGYPPVVRYLPADYAMIARWLLECFTHIQKQRVVIATIGILLENL